ncbi:hypothetical protein D1818_20230 [Aquimarina sp. BL5]|uniref:hypothetical protein n=1 Tax=Aquimarina sp. BL5 TaxID=1714860 RepID=UPI000E4DC79A|nr:hypothetical protein [Aquimarina sp. BL5]AXT53038.1 hypothetical protein D1818_20230 [Aquimarina sp. BL5]RKN07365.1 hypothetical protein D7036_07870 [Aquimarina sp. BL5]
MYRINQLENRSDTYRAEVLIPVEFYQKKSVSILYTLTSSIIACSKTYSSQRIEPTYDSQTSVLFYRKRDTTGSNKYKYMKYYK